MTTVAANLDSIASDLQVTHPAGHKFKLDTKIISIHQPAFYPVPFHVGLCGNLEKFGELINFLQYPQDYKKPPKIKGMEALVLTEDKKLFTFYQPTNWVKVDQKYYAVGSGSSFAMAAMEAGKTPLQAVKIASKFDLYTGLGFKSINLKKK